MAMTSILSKPLPPTFHDSSTRSCSGSTSRFLLPSSSHGCLHLTSITPYRRKKGMVIKCNAQPIPSPFPSGPPPPPSASGPGKGWIVGIVLTVILPFLKMGKWGPLLFYKNKVDVALQKVEDTVEMLEEVAERVDKEAEELYEKLPEGKLKNAVGFIEHIAEEAAKDAHLVDSAIDKVQEIEDKVEKYVESGLSKPSKTSQEEKTNNVEA